MTSFTNRIVTDLGMGRCEPAAVGGPFPPPGCDSPGSSGHLFQLAARSFRSTSLGGASLSLRASGIPCSSRSRVFVISARPNSAGASAPVLSHQRAYN
jgi:hypothetical protein